MFLPPSLLVNHFCDQREGRAALLCGGHPRAGGKPVVSHQEDGVLVISLPPNWLGGLLKATVLRHLCEMGTQPPTFPSSELMFQDYRRTWKM